MLRGMAIATTVIVAVAVVVFAGLYFALITNQPGQSVQHVTSDDAPEVQTKRRNQRLADLAKIRDALESYRRKNGSYPASTSNTWSRLYDGHGKANREWIPGLTPTFIAELPRDPRMLESQNEQYVYISNGENYKLLAGYPEKDCHVIKQDRPEMMDPVRNKGEQCEAYGYWSAGAEGL
jgi:hypothetical protein